MNFRLRIALALACTLVASSLSPEVRAQSFGKSTKPIANSGAVATVTPPEQFGTGDPTKGSQLGELHTSRYQFGIAVTTPGGPAAELVAHAPVPIEWPEQTVTVANQDVTPNVERVEYRMFNGTAKQMLAFIRQLSPGQEAKAILTLEIKRHSQLPPPDVSIFVLPNDKKLSPAMRQYLLPSPYIESTHLKIKQASRELMTTHNDANAWTKVEAIYDWTREKVHYVNGPIKGALKSLEDGTGDCEELTSLFIAVCRASNIPARVAQVPGHCYPEFYLEDAAGKGYWFPCQAAGTREFGGITEQRPVLQKGDNFLLPELPVKRQRYVLGYLTGKHLTGKVNDPKLRVIQQAETAATPTP